MRALPFVFLLPFTAAVSGQEAAPPAPKQTAPQQPALSADRQKGYLTIDPEQCRKWLTYLASDELRGRETGTPGYRKAADFVAARFAEFGLKPVGDQGTYFQEVPFRKVGPDAAKSYLAVFDGDGKELLRVQPGQGLGGQMSENSDREAEIIDVVANEPADIDKDAVAGKVVLFTDKSAKGRRFSRSLIALWNAAPAAIITVDDDAAKRPPRERISAGGARNRVSRGRMRRPNSYAISTETAATIRTALAKGPVKAKAHIEVRSEPVFAANVIGFLEGRDPKLKHEIVGIGSHLDHIGANGETINNGADDDGSGTTGVLAVAKAFTSNGKRPRRSILFMCFSGEEKGLVGSRHYVNNPIFPNEKMVAELQMDMIGRNEEFVNRRTGEVTEKAEDNENSLHLVGSKKLSAELHQICLDKNRDHIGFDFEYDEEDVFSRSDHANFARKDIPIAFFFTGFHPQYHRPDDTVDKINFPKLARVARLVYAIGWEVAEKTEPVRRDRKWSELPQRRR